MSKFIGSFGKIILFVAVFMLLVVPGFVWLVNRVSNNDKSITVEERSISLATKPVKKKPVVKLADVEEDEPEVSVEDSEPKQEPVKSQAKPQVEPQVETQVAPQTQAQNKDTADSRSGRFEKYVEAVRILEDGILKRSGK
jgi:hypothetical protein